MVWREQESDGVGMTGRRFCDVRVVRALSNLRARLIKMIVLTVLEK